MFLKEHSLQPWMSSSLILELILQLTLNGTMGLATCFLQVSAASSSLQPAAKHILSSGRLFLRAETRRPASQPESETAQ